MKSLVLSDLKRLEVTDLPAPRPAASELVVRVAACGICGSDVHGYDGSSGRRIPPIVMGHEAAGVVAETGTDVDRWRVGDRVTFDSTVYCGECSYCQRGQINLCDQRQVLGVSCEEYRRQGAFAEFVCVPQQIVHRLPNELPLEQAALVEPVSVAVHAVRRTPLTADTCAIVVGTGMIGLLVVQALRAAGCQKIAAVDRDPQRLEFARQFGASRVFNANDRHLQGQIDDWTSGSGTDVAIEAVGASEPLTTCIEAVRKGGHVTAVGNISPLVELPLQKIVTRELTLAGTCGSQGEYPDAIAMLRDGQIDVEPLISAVAPLEDAAEWFARLYAAEPGLMKVVLRP